MSFLSRWFHNKEVGDRGERIASSYLKKQGFKIVAKNWKDNHTEIDIIATYKDKLHIVEVKSRTTESWEAIGGSLTRQKVSALQRGAILFRAKNQKYTNHTIIFDVVAIFFDAEGQHKIEFVEDIRL